MNNSSALDWSAIDTVLLDMDGTLLDLRFDNWFWQDLIPSRYAAANGLSEAQTQRLLAPKFVEVKGTLQWYCIEYWSRELNLDIGGIKREALAQVSFLPGALEFLLKLKDSGKRRVLVTNAHPKTLGLKDERVALTRHFDACYSAHPFAAPKEEAAFWPRLAAEERFAPQRTLFVDDSVAVLDAARDFGIGWLRAVRRPDSGLPPQPTGDYAAVDRVSDLM
ncbi:MAG TPA: GMP/IMP nucleotidase [Steroidobacteraceae bacterium]|jgi:HAD superfamily hydrolase (TIGR01509 family)|nr:GMP/IMP nucleotidase [Steroidobacteraceae bacterium]